MSESEREKEREGEREREREGGREGEGESERVEMFWVENMNVCIYMHFSCAVNRKCPASYYCTSCHCYCDSVGDICVHHSIIH